MDRRGGSSETSGTPTHRIHGGWAHEPPVEVGSGTGSVVGAAAVVVGGAGGGAGAVVLGGALGGAAFEVDGGAAAVVPGSPTTGGAAVVTSGVVLSFGRVDRDAGGTLRTAFVAGAFFTTGAFWTFATVV
jgi:hypothetical protein